MRIEEISKGLFEIANIRSEYTGLVGCVWCSTKMASHGCRIKYYPKLSIKNESLVISLPDGNVVENTTKLKTGDIKEIIAFAIKNSDMFLNFWNNGTDWYTDEIDKYWLHLKKLDTNDIEKIKRMRLTKNQTVFGNG